MKLSSYFMPTMKESPQEADLASHQLMLRAGLIRKISAGLFGYLPAGMKVLRKIEDIVRREVESIGSQEILMPGLIPRKSLIKSKRWEEVPELDFTTRDHKSREYALSNKYEELLVELVRRDLRSYKELPKFFHSFQKSLDNEKRPRGGLLRSRDSQSLSAFSFHQSEKSLKKAYNLFCKTFFKTFALFGLEPLSVEDEDGTYGDSENHAFMIRTEAGDEEIMFCQGCGYAATGEAARFRLLSMPMPEPSGNEMEKVHTPGASSIESLGRFFKADETAFIKALVYIADGKPVMALVRGDRELNESKLRRELKAKSLRMAKPEEIQKFTGGPVGFSGPVNLPGIPVDSILADHEIMMMTDAVAGANEADYHYMNVNPERDFEVGRFVQLRYAGDFDICPKCGKMMRSLKALEVGHIHGYGTRFTEPAGALFDDGKGNEKPLLMGSYSINLSRLMAAVIETSADKYGIIWPVNSAPFTVDLIPVFSDNERQMEIAGNLFKELEALGIDAVIDDRDERPGFKFKDADLAGFPLRVVIGKRALKDGVLEVKLRREKEVIEVKVDEAVEKISGIIREEYDIINSRLEKFEECLC